MPGRTHGIRIVKRGLPIEQLLVVIGYGQRLEILRQLTESPRCVSELAKLLFISLAAVSRDLACLEEHGLVQWSREKNSHVYALSRRVNSSRKGDSLCIRVISDAGHAVSIELDESGIIESAA